jgi:amidase
MSQEKPLWQWSACDLAAAIAEKKISSSDAVASVVERMHESNGHINAVVDDLSEQALKEAAAHDEIMAKSGPIGPLHGVPVTIKENIDQEGRATPNGVTGYSDIIAPADSPVVNNLKAAGAIVVGRTNTPEFSFRGTTSNELHGRTYNPWNDWASAGGSSGGASAAVAAGYGPIAHGNDIGGSLRFPSYACGLTTVKPGLGRVPAYNPSAKEERGLLAQIMSVQGVIAREVRDVRLGLKQLLRYDPHDPWMIEAPFEGPPLDGAIKVGFTKNTFEFDLHPAVSQALDTARDALADAGYVVEEVEPPMVRETAIHGMRCLFGEAKVLMDPDVRKYGSDTVKQIFDNYYSYFEPFEGEDLIRALSERNRFLRAWMLFLQDYPLVLTPFLPQPIFTWDRDTEGMEGVKEVLGSALYSYSMNFLGLPAGIVQANYNDGVPVGVQVVGRRFREDLILEATEAIEERAGVMVHRLWDGS